MYVIVVCWNTRTAVILWRDPDLPNAASPRLTTVVQPSALVSFNQELDPFQRGKYKNGGQVSCCIDKKTWGCALFGRGRGQCSMISSAPFNNSDENRVCKICSLESVWCMAQPKHLYEV